MKAILSALVILVSSHSSLAMTKELKNCLQDSEAIHLPAHQENSYMRCLYQFKESISVNDCVKVATAMTFPVNRDQALTRCLTEIKAPSSKAQCEQIAGLMRFPHNQIGAMMVCENRD